MSDIRKWFMKQPHKNTVPEKERPKQTETPKQDIASEGANAGRKKVSKYFTTPNPDNTIKAIPDEDFKPEKASAKRKKQKVDVDDTSEIKVPSPKKLHKDNTKETKEKSKTAYKKDDGISGDYSDGPNLGSRGIGGNLSAKNGNENLPQHGGRGGVGRGGGGSNIGGRGRGGGRGPFGNFGERAAPPHKGEKEVPEGAENCLQGLTFVISGTLDSLEREEAEDLIKRHGGRVTGSVSKKTSYLLADEDVGGRKSEKAKELGTPFLSEDALFDMIRKSKPTKSSGKENVQKKDQKDFKVAETMSSIMPKIGEKGQINKDFGRKTSEKCLQPEVPDRKIIANVKGNTEIWTEKYRPKTSNDIIGNQSTVKQLHDWLAHWDEQHLNIENKGTKSKKRGSGSNSDISKKAVLLSGTPGIGKTTSARLISQMLGFTTIEVNASDNRGKADAKIERGIGGSTSNSIKELINNEALNFCHSNSSRRQKFVLIMDEVDGMSGGDRGGVTDLISSIKMSKIPIICICNDRYNQKLKSLVNYCLALNFRKPTKQQMAKRLHQIAELEGVQVDEIALEELGERVNGDMRMAINQLQYMSLSFSVLKYADMKARLQSNAKDEDVTPFTAVDKLLGYEGGRLKLDDRMNFCMTDPDLIPLIIQENYLNYKPSAASHDSDGTLRMDLIARAAESIADGDVVNVQIRRYRQWQHSQMGAFASCIIPAGFMHGQREVLGKGDRRFNKLAGWKGKFLTWHKNERKSEDEMEIHSHLFLLFFVFLYREALRMDYLPAFMLKLTKPLRTLPKEEGVQTVVKFMDEYSINQEDVDTIVDLCKFQGHPNPYDGVPPAVKSALAKAYKQHEQCHRVRAADLLPSVLYPGQKKTPKSKRVASLLTEVEDDFVLQNNSDNVEEEEELVDEEVSEVSAYNNGSLQLSLQENKPKGVEIQLDIKNNEVLRGKPSKANESKSHAEKEKLTSGTKSVKRKR
ncbi:replication factor C subunit 1 [Cryptomeria japonica]|uniref:replication factor C subunit 1 n=1 Tax=Cryptomeria japonica TaxID=3369 RepID=UPI0027D9F427|nr:replication factor C subunit 1 [Cryptomeria japonica]